VKINEEKTLRGLKVEGLKVDEALTFGLFLQHRRYFANDRRVAHLILDF